MQIQQTILSYYAQPAAITNLQLLAAHLDDLPTDISGLCRLVQNLYLHIFWAERYGYHVPDERQNEVQVRHAAHKLALTLTRSPGGLVAPRTPAERQLSNCRDFSTLTVALLRSYGHPRPRTLRVCHLLRNRSGGGPLGGGILECRRAALAVGRRSIG